MNRCLVALGRSLVMLGFCLVAYGALAFGLVTGAHAASPGRVTPTDTVEVTELSSTALTVAISTPGAVSIRDRKHHHLFRSSPATGSPPSVRVPLRLTKLAQRQLRCKGYVNVKVQVTFTPSAGGPSTQFPVGLQWSQDSPAHCRR
jgi:hypothetical protein